MVVVVVVVVVEVVVASKAPPLHFAIYITNLQNVLLVDVGGIRLRIITHPPLTPMDQLLVVVVVEVVVVVVVVVASVIEF